MESTAAAGDVKDSPIQTRALRLEWIRPEDLAENPANWRRHPEIQSEALESTMAAINVLGDDDTSGAWAGAALYNERTERLIDGHLRRDAPDGLLVDGKIPVIVGRWNEAQERLILATLDPLGAMAQRDEAAFVALRENLGREDEAISTALDSFPIVDTFVDPEPPVQIPEADEPPENPRTTAGTLYELGRHRVLCGDSYDDANVERLFDGRKVDALVGDPPYGIDHQTDYSTLPHPGKVYKKVAGDDKAFDPTPLLPRCKDIVLWGANCFPERLHPGTLLIWDKRTSTGGAPAFWSDAEAGWLNRGTGVYIFGHVWSGWSRTTESGEHDHPTKKPAALFVWVIERFLDKAKIIWDPFGGSGPIMAACEVTGRTALAMEIEPAYCDLHVLRYAKMMGEDPEAFFAAAGV